MKKVNRAPTVLLLIILIILVFFMILSKRQIDNFYFTEKRSVLYGKFKKMAQTNKGLIELIELYEESDQKTKKIIEMVLREFKN